jgi:hypothetical protein
MITPDDSSVFELAHPFHDRRGAQTHGGADLLERSFAIALQLVEELPIDSI